MFFRFQQIRHVAWGLPYIYPGTCYRLMGISSSSWLNTSSSIYKRLNFSGFKAKALFRYSTVSKTKPKRTADVLSFIRTSLHQPRGPSHCWLNKNEGSKSVFSKDGVFLVLVGEYLEGSFEANRISAHMFEKAKALQQRYPFLQVLALQCGKSICLNDSSTHLLRRVTREFVTFPILLSNKEIFETANMPCHIIFKGFQNPMIYPGEDVDLKVLDKAIHDLNVEKGKGAKVDDMGSTWSKPVEVVKEPDLCSASRNLLFSFPGCISVDESGNRLFLSDVNHHRIIVFDNNGKIVDAIGSSPGFEDGEFESAKLMRPAASFYHAYEDFLYFVDSENHAIRRADMEKRVVETVFPVTDADKGLWKWILDMIWRKQNTKLKSEDFNSESFLFPWHLLKSSDKEIFLLNQSFETLWIIDLEAGFIKEVVKEPSKILEMCGQLIQEKCMPLRHLPADWLQQQADINCSFEGIPYAGLMSSVATFQDDVIFCDTVGQTVVKFSEGSVSALSFPFSNFGTLGLPYWLAPSLERVYAVDDFSATDPDHLQCFRLLPGKVDIELNVDIPGYTDLVEQPQEGCVWCQARGAAIEVSGLDDKAAPSEKVGVAQKWYDEIDSLSFSTQQEESMTEEKSTSPGEDVQDDGRVQIRCTINTSPGTSEVNIYAALHLKLKKNPDSQDSKWNKAARIADILDPKGKSKKDAVVKLMMMSNRDMEDVIFVRPLHVRLKFTCDHHPKADNTKGIILTDSSVKVQVTCK